MRMIGSDRVNKPLALLVCFSVIIGDPAHAESAARQVLAFYYGWYGNPQVSHQWRQWGNVDLGKSWAENAADTPDYGAYDSHDPAIVDRQAEAARGSGITGFIASWWGPGSFEVAGCRCCLPPPANTGSRPPPITKKSPARMPRAESNPRLATSTICSPGTAATGHGCARAENRSCLFTAVRCTSFRRPIGSRSSRRCGVITPGALC